MARACFPVEARAPHAVLAELLVIPPEQQESASGAKPCARVPPPAGAASRSRQQRPCERPQYRTTPAR
eukprot:7378709-Prymnesium_polylepis.1